MILIWSDQASDGLIDQLIVCLLSCSEAVMVRRILTEPQRSKQRKDPPQPLLQDDDCCNQPFLKTQAAIDLAEFVAGAVDVEGVLDDSIDQRLLSGKGAEDSPLRNACRLGDLPGTNLAPELLQ